MDQKEYVVVGNKKYFVEPYYYSNGVQPQRDPGKLLDLRRLTISDIRDIKGLEQISDLKALRLSNNSIKSFEVLDAHTSLEQLSLGKTKLR
jgi:Leucine-rich repeat (LRR) protein